MKKWSWKLISVGSQMLLMLVMPFFLLIRGAVGLYAWYGWHTIPALLVAMLVVGVLLLIYTAMIWDAMFGANKITRRSLRAKVVFVSFLLLGFCGYMMFNFSAGNAKGKEVSKEFTSLHPFLRLSVGTFIWLDKRLLITDVSRVQEDYKKMGLNNPRHSLHYRQSTGFVHAMDLRTKGRSSLRNTLTIIYFKLLGFNTLRHVGTADHLHISLSVKDYPYRI